MERRNKLVRRRGLEIFKQAADILLDRYEVRFANGVLRYPSERTVFVLAAEKSVGEKESELSSGW
jgi:hypothetical protein